MRPWKITAVIAAEQRSTSERVLGSDPGKLTSMWRARTLKFNQQTSAEMRSGGHYAFPSDALERRGKTLQQRLKVDSLFHTPFWPLLLKLFFQFRYDYVVLLFSACTDWTDMDFFHILPGSLTFTQHLSGAQRKAEAQMLHRLVLWESSPWPLHRAAPVSEWGL